MVGRVGGKTGVRIARGVGIMHSSRIHAYAYLLKLKC